LINKKGNEKMKELENKLFNTDHIKEVNELDKNNKGLSKKYLENIKISFDIDGVVYTVEGKNILREMSIPNEEKFNKEIIWDSFVMSTRSLLGEIKENIHKDYFPGVENND
jgi:hypothetical protein